MSLPLRSEMKSVSDIELDTAYEGAAVFTNKFYVSSGAAVVRIAFCEGQEPKVGPQFRTAVAMSAQDALALAAVIKELMAQAGMRVVAPDPDEASAALVERVN